MKKILITGSCGFIFSNFMDKANREKWNYDFVGVDQVLASYSRRNIILNKKFYLGDVADEIFMDNVFSIEKPNIVIHGAAQSFVDDSIRSAGPFIHSNVVGTQVMVDTALKHNVERFIYISTDEVYGQLKDITDSSWDETTPPCPRNPYSASKLAGEWIVRAANQTHGLNYNITRCSNNYGPRQPPRNLIPKVISCLLQNKPIPIHGSGKQLREWMWVEDHCSAIMSILEKSNINEIYNIGSGMEFSNLDIVEIISQNIGVSPKIAFIKDRPGHDFRYSVNYNKITKLGWKSSLTFGEAMERTIKWYIDNIKYFDE